MPGATVEAQNLATNVVSRATTNGAGLYSFPVLPIGTYRVTVSAPGFKKSTREQLELRVGEQVQQDFALDIGTLTEQVTVTAGTELLQTLASDKGQVISQENIRDLPSAGRNAFMLSAVASGVQMDIGANAMSRSVRPFDAGNNVAEDLSINGGRQGASDLLLDGMPDTATETTSAANTSFVPSPDATQEFRIQTSNYDAQYGRTSGGTVSVSLKAGTNDYHGVAYWYNKNAQFYANTFDANRVGRPRSAFNLNEPGVEFQGPVVIPHLYDGHNRTFFMYSYELWRDSIPSPSTQSVPLPDQLQGNFNTTLQSNGQPVLIYDPATTVQTGSGSYSRQAFPGNQIPANRMNPVALKLASYIPAPNVAGLQVNNLVVSPNARTDAYDTHVARVDHVISDKHRLFARFVRGFRTEVNSTNGWAAPASQQYTDGRLSQGGGVDLTSVLSPTTVLTSRAGYMRHDLWIELYSSGFDPTQLGFPSSLMNTLPAYFPTISMSNYTTFGAGRSSGNQFSMSSSWSWSEVVNKTFGRHSVKFGGEFRSILDNINSPTSNFGSFAFTPAFTQANPLSASAANGNAVASLLLGVPNSGSANINAALAYGYHYYGTFVQDDWRATNKLTLSLGLRWDYESPVTERNNQENAGFDFTAASPLQVPGYNLTGGLLFTGGSNGRTPYQRDLNNVQPRVGVAWHVAPKTVVRGGYGLSYMATFTPAYNQGFSISTPYVSTAGGVLPSGNTLSNPYPEGILMPTGSSLGLSTFLGQSINIVDRDRVVPYVHQFSIGIQRELPWRSVLEVSYVGSRSHSLDVSKQINDVTAAQLQQYGSSLSGSKPNPFAGLLPGTGLNNANTSLQQLLRPYPQFTGITEYSIPVGQLWYNSLQVRYEKRLTRGLNFLVSYTYSKWMDGLQYLNNQDSITETPERTLDAQDTPHRVVLSGNWAIPLFGSAKGVVAAFLKGWQANGIFIRQVGFPLAAPGGYYSSGIDPSLPNPTAARYFNTCTVNTAGKRQNCASDSEPVAFIQQPPNTLRTLSLRFPSLRPSRVPSVDVSMFKSFTIHENLKVQFRAEAFNVTNSPQLGLPSTSMTSSAVGSVSPTQSNDPRNLQMGLRLSF